MARLLADIAHHAPAIDVSTVCSSAYEMFADDEDLMTLVVLQGRRPVGLVNRNDFLIKMAHLFGRALYDRKPVTQLMDSAPLIVDVGTDLAELNQRILVDKSGALLKGFIITEEESYIGVGNAHAVLQMNVDLLAAKSNSLEQAREATLQASLSKSRFLANMSHELRTPLNAVIGFSEEMAAQKRGPLGNEEYLEFARHIQQSGQHLLDLVNSVLEFTRIESGRYELMDSDVNIEALVEACVSMMAIRAEHSQLRLSVQFDKPVGSYRLDELRTRQTLINLLSNAIKFTAPGGEVRVQISKTEAGDLRVAVHDTGIGMSAGDIGRALEPFTQVDNDLNRRYEGSGLGLPLARSIVEMQGGTFDIQSCPGHGTCVSFTLPRRCSAEELLRQSA